MFKLLIGLGVILLLLTGCSDYSDCYNICRNIEYQKIDFNCNHFSTDVVLKKCDIFQDNILIIKEDCFKQCK